MNASHALSTVFPSARRPVTIRSALPLVVFLVVFLGGNLFLELRGIMRFSQPVWFVLTLTLPWVWWMHHAGYGGLTGFRATVALVTRLLLLGAFIMLLAEPRAVRKNNHLSVIYAVDLSDSIGEKSMDDAMVFIANTVHAKPEKDEAGLIVFARDAAVELPPRVTFSKQFEKVVTSRLAKDGTNLEKGLSLAAAMLPEDNPGRIVLMTDGVGTEGNLRAILDDLKSRNVPVDVAGVEYKFDNEAWLERLELPRFVKAGETYDAAILLSALKKGSGKLVLRENGQVIHEQPVEFESGKNRFTLPLYLRQPGFYEYNATLEMLPGEDGWQENNSAIGYLYLKGEGKVLLVLDPTGDERDWNSLENALRESKRVVERKVAYEFPRDALSLMPYDCVVFVNVGADQFDAVQLEAVRDAVYNQGIGFLMVGGQNSFGPGGYHRSAIEETLPVAMDVSQKKVLPKGALVIILHTCEFAEGNTWGRRIAKEAIRVLGEQDDVGLLILDWKAGGDNWVFPLTPASKYKELEVLINQCTPGDMPSFESIMNLGLNGGKGGKGLKDSDAAAKHMIIISDGDPAPPTPALLDKYKENHISVSTVSVFPHGGFNVGTLQQIANQTGGNYYSTDDPNKLPAIFIKEAKTLKRSMIQEKLFSPEIYGSSAILKGLDQLPDLKGYVLTSEKPRSRTILKGPEKEQVDPVLSTWRYGLGSAAAFTSDLSPKWGGNWVQWDKYQAFVKQLFTDISRVERESELYLRSFTEGEKAVITVEDQARQESFLELNALVSGPRGRTDTIPLKQVAPRRYQAEFPIWGKGRYQILAAGVGGGRNERVSGGFAVPYSPEYLRFRSNALVLKEIAEKTGGRELTGKETSEDIFPKDRKPREKSKPIFDWFILALAFLVPIDVALRRVQIDWSVVRGWFVRKKATESTATLGTLLNVKHRVESTLAAKREERPMQPTGGTALPKADPTRRPTLSQPVSEQPKTAEPGEESHGTTGKLLAAKKKWKKDQ